METATFYCTKCRTKVKAKIIKQNELRNGATLLTGLDVKGHKVYKFVKRGKI